MRLDIRTGFLPLFWGGVFPHAHVHSVAPPCKGRFLFECSLQAGQPLGLAFRLVVPWSYQRSSRFAAKTAVILPGISLRGAPRLAYGRDHSFAQQGRHKRAVLVKLGRSR